MSFSRDIDVTVQKALAMLGFVKRLTCEFGILILLGPFMCHLCARSLSTQVVSGGFFMTEMYDLPPYVDRCTLIRLETLTKRRSDACVMFVFDVLSVRIGSPSSLLSLVNVIAPRYHTRGEDFLRIDFHCTTLSQNYSSHDITKKNLRL
jgi:hypothetical protein